MVSEQTTANPWGRSFGLDWGEMADSSTRAKALFGFRHASRAHYGCRSAHRGAK